MPPPVVSVILNCCNHERYVAEAVESVLAQTFKDFELILIDNGSTDGSRRVLERYDDPRIRRFFHDENQSLSKRLNEGVAAARGDFVAILYSDDWMLPDKLERQVALLRNLSRDVGVVYCPALGFNQLSYERWQYPSMERNDATLQTLLRHHFEGAIDMSSPLTRRECFERYRWHEDLFGDGEAIFFRVAMHWKLHFDPHPTVVLRDHGANLGKAIQRNHNFLMTVLDRMATHPDFPTSCHSDLKSFRSRILRSHAWILIRSDSEDSRWIRSKLFAAVRLRPSHLFHPKTIIGFALAAFSSTVRKRINAVINATRTVPQNTRLVDNYAIETSNGNGAS